ncbi:hypothetical protein TNCV_4385691 [Trichonephila clavipes]|nr:hypothetical protein TNCV_4385691 [Trichonephila clavipes]
MAREGCGSYHVRVTNEGRRFVLGTFHSKRMLVLNRSRQNDRLRVLLVLVHIDIPPPQNLVSLKTCRVERLMHVKSFEASKSSRWHDVVVWRSLASSGIVPVT